MEKIDRLGWAAGLSFTAYGLRIGVRVNRPEALDRLHDLLPPGWKPAASARVDRLYSLVIGDGDPRGRLRRFNLLYADAARLARTLAADEVFSLLESDLQLFVAGEARSRLFIHAGAVSWRDRAILIPGRSFSGKTTLVAELVAAGATYYSDEYAVLDGRGRVHPYPKPLSMKEDEGRTSRQYRVEDLGGFAGLRPLPVGLVVLSDYQPGANWRPRQISPGQSVLGLLANTVSARRQPRAALDILRRALAGAAVLKGSRGEAAEVVRFILSQRDGNGSQLGKKRLS